MKTWEPLDPSACARQRISLPEEALRGETSTIDGGPLNYLTLYDNYLNYTIAYIVIFIA